ncbi:topoisomerase DNA-binding C4 zinc finger domain-containing protein [Acidiphilium multivorum]|uniref:topoisomerase DNA-binding C4 zinc finger domain-containing protein n=1 Tax=Acidiphilium multivorum TaxID=62140 RepID=UPI0002D57EE5
MGIGRPSTYASILENITSRSYVIEGKKGFLSPAPIGEKIRDALVSRFDFAELAYTKGLEDQLDEIAEGRAVYEDVVRGAWNALDGGLSKLDTLTITPAHPCPECGKALTRRKGQHGFFWSCTGWPDCKVTLPDEKGQPGKKKAPAPPTGIMCPSCGKELARRQGTSKPKMKGMKPRPYDFYSCTGFPKCEAKFQTGADGKPVFENQTKQAAE